jgi:hypothetical protein
VDAASGASYKINKKASGALIPAKKPDPAEIISADLRFIFVMGHFYTMNIPSF